MLTKVRDKNGKEDVRIVTPTGDLVGNYVGIK